MFITLYLILLKGIPNSALPYGSIVPRAQAVPVGGSIKIICHSHTKPKWTINGRKLGIIYYQGAVVFIRHAHESYHGKFRCFGTNSEGEAFEATSSTIVGRVRNDLIEPQNITANIGDTVTYTCNIHGKEHYWIFNYFLFTQKMPGNFFHFNAFNSITIDSVQLNNSGSYTCSNAVGILPTLIATSVLKVYDHSKIRPSAMVAKLGDTVNFTCESYGRISWQFVKNSKLVGLPSNTEVHKNTLFIRNVVPKNKGMYECQGEDKEEYEWLGQKVKFAARCTLALAIKSDTLTLPYQHSVVGKTVMFICNSVPALKWTFNDGPLPGNVEIFGEKQDRIQINNVQLPNDGFYKCITKDKYGTIFEAEGRLVVSEKKDVCPHHSISKGQATFEGYSVGSEVLYECKKQTFLKGSSRRMCLDSGEWSGSEPTCIDKLLSSGSHSIIHTLSWFMSYFSILSGHAMYS